MQYYDFAMYEEYNFQTASGTAESDVAGIYMNMVTRSGGNDLQSSHVIYFMNDATQSDNIDDDLRHRVGLAPGQETALAGNPIDVSYDWNSTVGGPIARDKAWFFGSIRWWRMDQFQIGATIPFAVNSNDAASATLEWNDLDGDKMLSKGPSGTFRDSAELAGGQVERASRCAVAAPGSFR